MALMIKFVVAVVWCLQVYDVTAYYKPTHKSPTTRTQPVHRRVQTYQTLNTPLTVTLCRDERYRHLRACTAPAYRQQQYGRRWLCPNRNAYVGNNIPWNGKRVKRSVANPCSGRRIRVAVMVAVDRNGIERELVVDRANFLYQTIIIEECAIHGARNFQCQPHNITFEAAVFSSNQNSNEISVQDVSVQAYCALSIA